MTILSASSWQDGIFWHLTINTSLTTSPGSVSVEDSSGVNSFPITSFSAGVINVTVKTFDQFFEIAVPGEVKKLPFGAESEEEATQDGVILAPSGYYLGLYPFITIPMCDLSRIKVEVFTSSGTKIITENPLQTPDFLPNFSSFPSLKVIDGSNVLAIDIRVVGSYQATEGGSWLELNSLHNYRIVVSEIHQVESNLLFRKSTPSRFFGKKYYTVFA